METAAIPLRAPLRQILQHLCGHLAYLTVEVLLGHHVGGRVPLDVQELLRSDAHREQCPPGVAVHDLTCRTAFRPLRITGAAFVRLEG
ncbi:hypothetical protein DMA15_19940 [Streptomyces sp. WAC 01529]|nr:hypothetical protein DMA15_19940 [Streptomyces sp. WAC 01529]